MWKLKKEKVLYCIEECDVFVSFFKDVLCPTSDGLHALHLSA